MADAPIATTVYAMVRHDTSTGEDWVDLATVGHHPKKAEAALRKAAEGREFNQRNPNVRVARFLMEEI